MIARAAFARLRQLHSLPDAVQPDDTASGPQPDDFARREAGTDNAQFPRAMPAPR